MTVELGGPITTYLLGQDLQDFHVAKTLEAFVMTMSHIKSGPQGRLVKTGHCIADGISIEMSHRVPAAKYGRLEEMK